MVNRNLLRQFDLSDAELQEQLTDAFDAAVYDAVVDDDRVVAVNKVVTGHVLHVLGDEVVVDIGYKSEGVIPLDEWKDEATGTVRPPAVGDTIEVLLEEVEDEDGIIALSYRKARRQKQWEQVVAKYKEGDTVTGPVT